MEEKIVRFKKAAQVVSFACSLLTSLASISSAAVTIDWEIGNRYRAFDYINKGEQRSADESARLFKRFAPRPNEGDTKAWLSRLLAEEKSPFGNNSGPWIESAGKNTSPYQKDFVDPPKHIVLTAKLVADGSDLERLAETNCSWSIDSTQFDLRPCNEPIYKSDFPGEGGIVSVHQGHLEIVSKEIKPRVKIIMGLGDSYASGEGNPDVPTVWNTPGNNKPWPPKNKDTVKEYIQTKASWWSNRCDRSFYSHQNMVALRLAANDKHSLISFVHLACSGAEVVDGLLAPQRFPPGSNAKICSRPEDRSDPDKEDQRCDAPYSQLHAAVTILCRDEPMPPSEQLVADVRRLLQGLRHGHTQWKWVNATELVSCPNGRMREIELGKV
jgi:hypothetical protein